MTQPVNWRWVSEGLKVWVYYRKKWIPGIVDHVGSNKAELTIVKVLSTESRQIMKRKVNELFVRKSDDDYPDQNV